MPVMLFVFDTSAQRSALGGSLREQPLRFLLDIV